MKDWMTGLCKAVINRPGRVAALALLAAFAMLLWGRLLLKHVPRTATATPSAEVARDTDGADELSDAIDDESD